jgi:hypothetical protein
MLSTKSILSIFILLYLTVKFKLCCNEFTLSVNGIYMKSNPSSMLLLSCTCF